MSWEIDIRDLVMTIIALALGAIVLHLRRSRASAISPDTSAPAAPQSMVGGVVRARETPPINATPTCRHCASFDLDAGQQVIASQPVFAEAARHIPVWRMGRAMKLDANGDPLPDSEQVKDIPQNLLDAKWTDMGACAKHHQLRIASDRCNRFEPKLVQLTSKGAA